MTRHVCRYSLKGRYINFSLSEKFNIGTSSRLASAPSTRRVTFADACDATDSRSTGRARRALCAHTANDPRLRSRL